MNGWLGNKNDQYFYKNNIKFIHLSTEKVYSSHLLEVYPSWQKAIAYPLSIYPDNILTFSDQWNLVKEGPFSHKKSVNRSVLKKEMNNFPVGQEFKVEFFEKSFFSFKGHSCLVKKNNKNKFVFFDPNEGEYQDLTFDQLCNLFERVMDQQKITDLYLLTKESYFKWLNISSAKATIISESTE